MWICLNDAFFSIVRKDCTDPDQLLVRARREGDIEKVFGRDVKVERDEFADYLYRARIGQAIVADVMRRELFGITYGNFKDSVKDHDLHHCYLRIWNATADMQKPGPYSGYKKLRSQSGPVPSWHSQAPVERTFDFGDWIGEPEPKFDVMAANSKKVQKVVKPARKPKGGKK
jgi:hypothetical protein